MSRQSIWVLDTMRLRRQWMRLKSQNTHRLLQVWHQWKGEQVMNIIHEDIRAGRNDEVPRTPECPTAAVTLAGLYRPVTT